MKGTKCHLFVLFTFISFTLLAQKNIKKSTLTNNKDILFSTLPINVNNKSKNPSTFESWKNRKIFYFPLGYKDTLTFLNDLRNVLRQKYKYTKNVKIAKSCDCTNKLLLVEGEGLEFINIYSTPGGGESCNDSPLCKQSESIEDKDFELKKVIEKSHTRCDTCRKIPVRIAILDTGINPNDNYLRDKLGYFYGINTETPSNLSDIFGINTVNPSNCGSLNDNSSNNHGTKVSKIMIGETKEKTVKIIPIKIFEECPGSLFDALCGILHAENLKVDIINASWVFQANDQILKVTSKIMESLRLNNIMFVAAAGNTGPYSTNGEPTNIYYNPLYPACFSYSFGNVITATTLKRENLSLIVSENMSENFVNIGVEADSEGTLFNIPNESPEAGSSYAAAKVTAELSKFLYSINEKNSALVNNIVPNIIDGRLLSVSNVDNSSLRKRFFNSREKKQIDYLHNVYSNLSPYIPR